MTRPRVAVGERDAAVGKGRSELRPTLGRKVDLQCIVRLGGEVAENRPEGGAVVGAHEHDRLRRRIPLQARNHTSSGERSLLVMVRVGVETPKIHTPALHGDQCGLGRGQLGPLVAVLEGDATSDIGAHKARGPPLGREVDHEGAARRRGERAVQRPEGLAIVGADQCDVARRSVDAVPRDHPHTGERAWLVVVRVGEDTANIVLGAKHRRAHRGILAGTDGWQHAALLGAEVVLDGLAALCRAAVQVPDVAIVRREIADRSALALTASRH
mmetsp:Transcript_95622/g.274499  ORF Transcript_95622/g.274499 Transcript_95622/m.274499 type:complete len:271 (+) Transcript_95622:82-894(+)